MSNQHKRSLEEAIRLAKVVVDNDENRIIVQRVHQSRKVARVKRSSDFDMKQSIHMDHASTSVDVQRLTIQVEELTNAVANAATETDAVLARNEKLDQYVKLLEEKIKIQEKTLLELTQSSNPVPVEEMTKKLAFYELITSLQVVVKDNNRFLCTLKNSVTRSGSKFEITINLAEATDDVSENVLNMHCRPVANAHLLPDYLQSEIDCSHRMAPVLLGDCLQLLYEDK